MSASQVLEVIQSGMDLFWTLSSVFFLHKMSLTTCQGALSLLDSLLDSQICFISLIIFFLVYSSNFLVINIFSSDAFMCLASRFPPQHAINDFDVHDSKEFGCENMHKEGTNDNGTRPSCHKVCLNVDGNLETKTKEVCGLSEKFQGSSIKEHENLEQKATSSYISIVLEGKTTISEQDDRESNTASFNGKDERRKLPNKGKEEAAKENFVDDKKNEKIHWDVLRQEACRNYPIQQRTLETLDSVDYASLRNATVEDVASAIKIRGMNNRIAAQIQVIFSSSFKKILINCILLNAVFSYLSNVSLFWRNRVGFAQ